MVLSIIVAMTKDRVIGKDNKLLWHIPSDLKNFKKLTTGKVVIMGRKTFESIGKPLPNRHNIVLSRTMNEGKGYCVSRSVVESIEIASKYSDEVFIIGGESIYKQFMHFADKMYITHIRKEYNGDTYFPEYKEKEWNVKKIISTDEYILCEYERI